MAKEIISFKEFQRLDLRSARVMTAEPVEGTDKLLKMQIDLGSEQRQIVAGIAQEYSIDELVGRDILIVANLQPAKIRGVESNGMLLAANLDGVAVLACFDKEVPPGAEII